MNAHEYADEAESGRIADGPRVPKDDQRGRTRRRPFREIRMGGEPDRIKGRTFSLRFILAI